MNPKATEVVVTPRPDGLPIVAGRVEFEDPSDPADVPIHARRGAGPLEQGPRRDRHHAVASPGSSRRGVRGFSRRGDPSTASVAATSMPTHVFVSSCSSARTSSAASSKEDVNLTHVNARKVEIVWDEDDLSALLTRRIGENEAFVRELGDESSKGALFGMIFPSQVDPGDRKPTTWRWMMKPHVGWQRGQAAAQPDRLGAEGPTGTATTGGSKAVGLRARAADHWIGLVEEGPGSTSARSASRTPCWLRPANTPT